MVMMYKTANPTKTATKAPASALQKMFLRRRFQNGFIQSTRGLRDSRPPALQYEVDADRDVRTRDYLFLEGVESAVV